MPRDEDFWHVDWEEEEAPFITKRQEEVLDRIAREVVDRQMTVPVVMFLESVKPLNWIASQVMLFLEPIYAWILGLRQIIDLRRALQKREAIPMLIEKIEAYERLRQERLAKSRKKRSLWRRVRAFFGKGKMLLLVLLLASAALGQTNRSPDAVELVRLKFGGGSDWYNGPTELPNLAKFVRENCGVNVFATGKYVEPLDEDLFKYPFIFMTGHGNCYFTEQEAQRLREYLEAGGFLLVNDDYGLDKAFRRELKKIFPDKELVELPFDHPIYHCFYDFPNGLPKIHEHDGKPPQGFGIFVEGRLVLFYVYESDIADGWDDPDVHGDPPEKREAALKMGANILIYALTH